MWGHILLGITGFSGGIIIAGGLVAFLIELKIVPRYAGITSTAKKVLLYENCIVAGSIWGNLMTVYPISLPLGTWFLYLFGLCGGIFIGSWIIALTEVLDILPITVRRVGVKKGFASIVIAAALGKVIASLCFSFFRWQ